MSLTIVDVSNARHFLLFGNWYGLALLANTQLSKSGVAKAHESQLKFSSSLEIVALPSQIWNRTQDPALLLILVD